VCRLPTRTHLLDCDAAHHQRLSLRCLPADDAPSRTTGDASPRPRRYRREAATFSACDHMSDIRRLRAAPARLSLAVLADQRCLACDDLSEVLPLKTPVPRSLLERQVLAGGRSRTGSGSGGAQRQRERNRHGVSRANGRVEPTDGNREPRGRTLSRKTQDSPGKSPHGAAADQASVPELGHAAPECDAVDARRPCPQVPAFILVTLRCAGIVALVVEARPGTRQRGPVARPGSAAALSNLHGAWASR